MLGMPRLFQVTALLLLGSFGAYHHFALREPPGAEPYFERIRQAGAGVAPRIGPWVGEDVAVPGRVTTVLKPNLLLSRQYTNIENGSHAGLLLVHCSNAHHMVGHFPMRCYPASGWEAQEQKARAISAGGLNLPATEYRFTQSGLDGTGGERSITVVNVLMRPGGLVLRDMDELSRSIVGANGPGYGAGQMQFYFEGTLQPDQIDSAIRALLAGYEPVVAAILANAGGMAGR